MQQFRALKTGNISLAFLLIASPLTAATWVNNLNEPYEVAFTTAGVYEQASSFVTGPQSYRLQSVTVVADAPTDGSALLRIYGSGFSTPSDILQSSAPVAFSAGNSLSITFPNLDVMLAPSLRYWAALSVTGNQDLSWEGTASTAEISIGGWSIGDEAQYRVISTNTWHPIEFGPTHESGLFSVNAVLAADFDADGDVDGADFVIWQTHFPKLSGAHFTDGDADADGDVDGADFVVWQTSFPSPPSPGSVSVPEPATAFTVILAAAALLASRRLLLTRLGAGRDHTVVGISGKTFGVVSEAGRVQRKVRV